MITVENLLTCPFTVNVMRYKSIALAAKGKHTFKSEAEYLPYKEVLVALEKDGMMKLSAGEAAPEKIAVAPQVAPKVEPPAKAPVKAAAEAPAKAPVKAEAPAKAK